MFKLLTLAGTLAAWKHSYCNGSYARCARYVQSQSGARVPSNLMPNGVLLKIAGKP